LEIVGHRLDFVGHRLENVGVETVPENSAAWTQSLARVPSPQYIEKVGTTKATNTASRSITKILEEIFPMLANPAKRKIVEFIHKTQHKQYHIASRKRPFFAFPSSLGSCLRNLALHQFTLTTSNHGECKNIKNCFFMCGPVIKVSRVHIFHR